jgi:hypothetical protein
MMRTHSACPHCKSPKRHDPCWWGIRHVDYNPDAYDPPCFEDSWNEEARARELAEMRGVWSVIIAFVAVLGILIVMATTARGQEYHSNPELLKWIPATCCVTNDCCWEIAERELKPLPDDEFEVRSTGQVRKRTAFSPDGKFYRCACDYDNVSKNWVKHQGANTRCLFIPMRSANFSPRR